MELKHLIAILSKSVGTLKITLPLFCLLMFAEDLYAQKRERKIDSLKTELERHKGLDTTRIDLLTEIGYLNYRIDLNETAKYVEEAENLSKEINYPSGIARCIYIRGVIELMHSNFDQAMNYFENSAQLYVNLDHRKRELGNSYMSIGAVHYYQSNYEQALLNYKKALAIREALGLPITNAMFNIAGVNAKIGLYDEAIAAYKRALMQYEESNDQKEIANCLNSMAAAYNEQGNFPLALEYHTKSLSVSEAIRDSIGIARSLNNIGNSYELRGHYDQSLDYYQRALIYFEKNNTRNNVAEIKTNIASIYIEMGELSKAIEMLNESMGIANEIGDKEQSANCLNKLGFIHSTLEDYRLALKYYQEAKEVNMEISNQLGLGNNYIGIANVFLNWNKYDEALINALKANEIASRHDFLTQQRDVQQILSKIYSQTGDFQKAFKSQQQFKTLNDSLFNKKNIEKIAQLEYEYMYKQALDSASIRELELTQTVMTTSQELAESRQNFLWAVIGILLVSILFGAVFFYQQLNHLKAKTQNIITEQKLLRSQMTPHFVFNSLSVLQGMILNKEEEKSVSYLSKFSRLLRLTLENSRDQMVMLSQELMAIENYLALQSFEDHSYVYTIDIDQNIDTALFKIPPMLIQPFIENAIEHAFENQIENQKIEMHLKYSDEALVCVIMDNGIGINAIKEKARDDKKSLATSITSERLNILSTNYKMKGSVKVEDRVKYNEKGTIVTLVIPYEKLDVA